MKCHSIKVRKRQNIDGGLFAGGYLQQRLGKRLLKAFPVHGKIVTIQLLWQIAQPYKITLKFPPQSISLEVHPLRLRGLEGIKSRGCLAGCSQKLGQGAKKPCLCQRCRIVQVQWVLHTDPTSHREDYLEMKPDQIQDDKRCLLWQSSTPKSNCNAWL